MRPPVTPWTPSPLSSASPASTHSSPRNASPPARSAPRPIPTSSASAYTRAPTTPIARSAPAAPSPVSPAFWSPGSPSQSDDTFETFKRERELRARQAEFERQREHVRHEAERLKEEAAKRDERRKRDVEAAHRLMEQEYQRKLAEDVAAAHERAARHRQVEDAARRKEEERQRRDMERTRHEEAQRHRTIEAWEQFEQGWRSLCSGANAQDLTFASIPWPMESQPTSALDINGDAIRKFLLSPLHSANKPAKQRLREQLLRYHPDRFESRILRRVSESDRASVKQAVNTVAQCLNDALAQQNSL